MEKRLNLPRRISGGLEKKEELIMIAPRKVRFQARKKENENLAFRMYLKGNAEAEKLDEQFRNLHRELFDGYDCRRCRNCCKMYRGTIPEEDVERDAEYLGLTREQFIGKYLVEGGNDGSYPTKSMPCDFLEKDGECILGECRPDTCRKFPYTDQPERLGSLYGVLEVIGVCPVAYEIWERLKEEYRWKYNTQSDEEAVLI